MWKMLLALEEDEMPFSHPSTFTSAFLFQTLLCSLNLPFSSFWLCLLLFFFFFFFLPILNLFLFQSSLFSSLACYSFSPNPQCCFRHLSIWCVLLWLPQISHQSPIFFQVTQLPGLFPCTYWVANSELRHSFESQRNCALSSFAVTTICFL